MKRSHARVGWIVGLVGGAALLGVGAYAMTGGSTTAAAAPTPSGGGGTAAKSGSPGSSGTSGSGGAAPTTATKPPIKIGPILRAPAKVTVNPVVVGNITLTPGQLPPATLSISGTNGPMSLWFVGGATPVTNINATSSNIGAVLANNAVLTPAPHATSGSTSTISVSFTDSSGNSQMAAVTVTIAA